MQLFGLPVIASGFNGVHRWAIEPFHDVDELLGALSARQEGIGVFDHRYLVIGDASLLEALDDVRLDTPCHRTDEALWRRRRERRTDLQQLRNERGGIVGD